MKLVKKTLCNNNNRKKKKEKKKGEALYHCVEIVDEEAGAEVAANFAAAAALAVVVAAVAFAVDELYATRPCDMSDKFVGVGTKTSNSWHERCDCTVIFYKLSPFLLCI